MRGGQPFLPDLAGEVLVLVIDSGLSMAQGRPFRKPLYTNHRLVATLAFQLLFLAYLALSPGDPVTREFAELVNDRIPFAFRVRILELVLANLAVAWVVGKAADLLVSNVRVLQEDMVQVSGCSAMTVRLALPRQP